MNWNQIWPFSVFNWRVSPAKMAKWFHDMAKVAKEEIHTIRMCDECYINLNQSERVDMVCKQSHLVVWAKQKSYPYWPAKLMSVNATTNKVDVRYFGARHSRAIITSKDCYLYSVERPSLSLGKHKKAFDEAQQVTGLFSPPQFIWFIDLAKISIRSLLFRRPIRI